MFGIDTPALLTHTYTATTPPLTHHPPPPPPPPLLPPTRSPYSVFNPFKWSWKSIGKGVVAGSFAAGPGGGATQGGGATAAPNPATKGNWAKPRQRAPGVLLPSNAAQPLYRRRRDGEAAKDDGQRVRRYGARQTCKGVTQAGHRARSHSSRDLVASQVATHTSRQKYTFPSSLCDPCEDEQGQI